MDKKEKAFVLKNKGLKNAEIARILDITRERVSQILGKSSESQNKYEARKIFRSALISGKIQKLPCSVCGSNDTQAHHPDYSKPLDVIWVCKKHHREIHKSDTHQPHTKRSPNLRLISTRLDEETVSFYKKYGNGNMSEGIRKFWKK